MTSQIRTDLAIESLSLCREGEKTAEIPEGVRAEDWTRNGFHVSFVEILDERGEAAIGKPAGRYYTLELDNLIHREENAFPDAAELLADLLRPLLPSDQNASLLVAGLGNREITPDAVGPDTVEYVLVTRHLKEQLPEDFAVFRPVSAVCSGVLGTTGIESSDLVHAVTEKVRPEMVLAVDALASRSTDRLCRTIQISNTGIIPGSGVGNARRALNQETLRVPVIAIGVPTVVDVATLALDFAARAGFQPENHALDALSPMIVTPREIDQYVRDVAKLIGYGMNLAFHDGLSISDLDMLLS